jgi:site-specific DNA recombinase
MGLMITHTYVSLSVTYPDSNDYLITDTYIDRAQSGRSDRRVEFQKMMDHARDNKFKYILIYQYDRFSRNRRHSINYKYELSKLGVTLISVTEPLADSPEKIFLEGFLENMAEYYVLDLSRKTRRGMDETFKKRNSLGGTQILGYKVVDKKIVIDEPNAKIARYIFESVAEGITFDEIADELNAKGYKNNRGKEFSKNSFQHMLKNRKYIGEYERDGEVYYDYFDPIIDRKLFDTVQKRLDLNKRKGGGMKRKNENYLLSGKAFCGICGSPLVGVSTVKNKTKKYTYYACSKSYRHRTCEKTNISKTMLEELVADITIDYLLDEQRSQFIIDSMYDEIIKATNEGSDSLKGLIKTKTKLESQLETLYTNFKNTSSQVLLRKLNEEADVLGEKIKSIALKISAADSQIKKLPTKEQLVYWLYSHAVGDINSDKFKDRIYKHLVNQVFLSNDNLIVYFNIEHSRTVSLSDMQDDLTSGKLASVRRECSYGEYNGDPYGIRTHECMRERHVS